MFFSIIVPIYNVEKYLKECINSVLQQEFKDYELILVDDGSTDNCPQICDEFALKEDRIRVIHKKNGGLSDARNAGLEVCNGKYTLFLDSDDFLTENCLNKAYDLLIIRNMPDILLSTFNSLFDDQGQEELNRFKLSEEFGVVANHKILLNTLLKENNEIPWSAWRNIYKTALININYMKFEKGLVGAEDCSFFMEYMKYVKSYLVMEYPIVNYRVSREGSITNTIKYNTIIGQLNVFSKYFKEYKQSNISNNHKDIIYEHFAQKFANTISTFYFLSEVEEINGATKIVKENKEILKFAYGKKYIIAKILWNIFGYYKGSQIMNKARR